MNCRLKTILSRWGIFTSRSTLKWPRQLKSGADLCLIKTKTKKKDCERYRSRVTLAPLRSFQLGERHSIRLPSDEKCKRLNVMMGKGRLLRWRQRQTQWFKQARHPDLLELKTLLHYLSRRADRESYSGRYVRSPCSLTQTPKCTSTMAHSSDWDSELDILLHAVFLTCPLFSTFSKRLFCHLLAFSLLGKSSSCVAHVFLTCNSSIKQHSTNLHWENFLQCDIFCFTRFHRSQTPRFIVCLFSNLVLKHVDQHKYVNFDFFT